MTNYFIDRHTGFSDYIVHPPPIITKVFNNYVWNIPTNDKILYLTFDDGPIPVLTEKVLEILEDYNAKATFFCVGDNVKKHPKIYNKILKEEHSVGNHTFSHLNGWKTDNLQYKNNIEIAEQYIESSLFRPPYGKLKNSQFAYLKDKYHIILWDVLSVDYDKNITPSKCFRNIKQFAKPGSVIVFHDNYKAQTNMLYSLKKTLEYYSLSGYKFKKITPELLQK